MTTDKKTLLEHHYELRIEALKDDPRFNYSKRLVTVELLATELGWRHLCDREYITYRLQNIYNA
jgi:hypothetical protein